MDEAATNPAPKQSRKQKLLLLVLFLLAMGGLAVWMMGGFKREPLHKGKPISYWVDGACVGVDNDESMSFRREVESIGPDAVPYLAARLRASGRWREKWNSLQARLPKFLQKILPKKLEAWEIHHGAAWTITMLGPVAKSAVPGLVRLLPEVEGNGNSPAIGALGAIGPDAREALPALHGMLTNQNGYLRVEIARALWQIGRETNQVLQICTNLIVPDGNAPFTVNACGLLGNLGVAAAPAVPRVLQVLQNTNSNKSARGNAAIVLGVARVSSPEIRAALLDGVKPGQDDALQSNCAMALWALDPQYAPMATRLTIDRIVGQKRRFPKTDPSFWDFTRWVQYRGLDPNESIPTLKELLKSDSDDVREEAARVLEKIEALSKTGAKQ